MNSHLRRECATQCRRAVVGMLVLITLTATGCARKAVEAEKRMPVPVLAAVVGTLLDGFGG